MGLEGADHPVIPQRGSRVQKGLQFPGVVGIVIIDGSPLYLTLKLKPAAGAPEILQPLGNGIAGNPQDQGRSSGGDGVLHVVLSRHLEGDVGHRFFIPHQVEGREPMIPGEIFGMEVAGLQAEGEHALLPLQGLHHIVEGVGVAGDL